MKRFAGWLAGFVALACSGLFAADVEMMTFGGPTMGTRYSVKVYDPPEFAEDVQIGVDRVLRQVNDQMSTYLKSSEISRFNDSDSLDWFDVSPETAQVVDFAQQVAKKTDGAFDVTVGPLVNAWSFGPDPRTQRVPDPQQLQALRESIGYAKLQVRLDPPALRKSVPGLRVDLSAIAKGHGVDRVVQYLADSGAENVFVEIGGEVRTRGDKSGQWWKVGIQRPDAEGNDVMIAHSLSTGAGGDESMATSGDYRIFFEQDGVRYSHTIDPRTGRPITHNLASVSVVADSCMAADSWATAINVLGPAAGLEAARREGLGVLLISRQGDRFELAATGVLQRHVAAVDEVAEAEDSDAPATNPLALWGITAVAFALVLAAMAVGVIFGRRSISGSCGGLANARNEDGSVQCSLCSNPAEACQELRERMKQGDQAAS